MTEARSTRGGACRRLVALVEGPLGDRLDRPLAAIWLVALEAEVLVSNRRHGPLALNLGVVAAMALAGFWRRRAPLLVMVVVGLGAVALSGGLTSFRYFTLAGLYTVSVPTYSVAVGEPRRRAVAGLVIWLAGAAVAEIGHHAPAANFIPGTLTGVAVWAAGRAIRFERTMADNLQQKSERLAAEREARARALVANERTRIARELHGAIARDVAAIVVQAQAARQMLDDDWDGVDDVALCNIENAGRQALVEMRRLVGVLRRGDAGQNRTPQPGVRQFHEAVQQARARGQAVKFSVEGETGPWPGGVELALFRILHEALDCEPVDCRAPMSVTLRFQPGTLELRISSPNPPPSPWPTEAIRQRVALYDGQLKWDRRGSGWTLVARIPRHTAGIAT